jgi:hypothetical protein
MFGRGGSLRHSFVLSHEPGDRMKQFALTAVRSLFGLFFFSTGMWILVSVTTGLTRPPAQPTPGAAAFMDALSATGFMDPLLALSFILGGGFVIFDRSAPLGLVILAPAVLVILLFHLVLSQQILVGITVAGVFLVLAWLYRGRLACLWRAAG